MRKGVVVSTLVLACLVGVSVPSVLLWQTTGSISLISRAAITCSLTLVPMLLYLGYSAWRTRRSDRALPVRFNGFEVWALVAGSALIGGAGVPAASIVNHGASDAPTAIRACFYLALMALGFGAWEYGFQSRVKRAQNNSPNSGPVFELDRVKRSLFPFFASIFLGWVGLYFVTSGRVGPGMTLLWLSAASALLGVVLLLRALRAA